VKLSQSGAGRIPLQRREYSGSFPEFQGNVEVVTDGEPEEDSGLAGPEEIALARLQRLERLTPQAALRLRHMDLERTAKDDCTVCDQCGHTKPRDEALESWVGGRCVWVSCLDCLRGSSLEVEYRPDGLKLSVGSGDDRHSTIRAAHSLFPSSHRPK